MAVLRRKVIPCTKENPCDIGEGDCNNENDNCKAGLKCQFRLDTNEHQPGEAVHGVEFTGDLLINENGPNDICYNPKWPDHQDTTYEGKVVQTIGKPELYLVLDGTRRQIPDEATFDGLWKDKNIIIMRPENVFEDLPVYPALCEDAPIIKGYDSDDLFFMVDNRKRWIATPETFKHLQFDESTI